MIEISVAVPDDYDDPLESTTVESSVYIGVDEARRFAKALQTAIARAESELAGRAKLKPKKKGGVADGRATSADAHRQKGGAVLLTRGVPTAMTPAAVARAAAKAEAAHEAAKRKEQRAAESKRRAEPRALEATLKELKGTRTRR